MKLHFLRLGFVSIFALSALAQSQAAESLLLRADSMKVETGRHVATGRAEMRSNSGQTRITADTISYDEARGVIEFAGAVTIHSGENAIETKAATLNVQGKRVFMLSKGALSPAGAEQIEIKAGATGAEHMRLFGEPYRKLDTKLVPPAK